MKHLIKLLLVALLLTMALPVVAQEEEPPAGPGEGGILIDASFTEPGSLNPIYCTSTSCTDDVDAFLFPLVAAVDVSTATFAKDLPYGYPALAYDWEVSEDGRTYTFKLREDMFWTDGQPVTAYDVEWTFNTTIDPEAASPNSWIAGEIDSVVALDDYTVEFTFPEPYCGIIGRANSFRVVPKHVFDGVPLAELENHSFTTNPNVTAGVFSFGEYRVAEQTSMVANQGYPDTTYGYVVPAGRILAIVPDQTVAMEQLLAGEITEQDFIPPDRRDDILAAAEAGTLQVYEYSGNTWDYLGLNNANPENPQPGLDADGNPIPQDPHPLFGDKRVRKAVAMAIDVDAIIEGAVFGYGTRMTANVVPASWAYNHDLPPVPFDPTAALALLAEAGWVPGDDGVLVATEDALYAEPGTRFEFQLLTNQGNTRREAIGTIVQDQLQQLGMVVDYQAIEWNTLLEITDAQTYDAVIMGWRAGYPDNPGSSMKQIFTASSDDPVAGGSNDMSFYNAEFEALLEEVRTTPGCDEAVMKEGYAKLQEIMQDEMPYVWLYVIDGMYVTRGDIVNFGPYPAQMTWNVDAWAVASPE